MALALFVAAVLLIIGFLLFTNFRGMASVTALLFGFFVVASPIAYLETSGHAKPLFTEWRNVDGSRVLGTYPSEEEGVIYVWLRTGSSAPRLYTVPWNPKDAENAQEVTNDPKEERPVVFNRSAPGAKMFDMVRRPELPEKIRR